MVAPLPVIEATSSRKRNACAPMSTPTLARRLSDPGGKNRPPAPPPPQLRSLRRGAAPVPYTQAPLGASYRSVPMMVLAALADTG
jgi:hypothetical protein